MGDKEEGDAHLLLKLGQFAAHGLAQLSVQGGERLIQEQQAGPPYQSPRQGDPLLLTARELMRAAVTQSAQLHDGEGLLHAPPPFWGGNAVHLEAKGDVLGDAHMRKESIGLEDHAHGPHVRRNADHILAIDQDSPGVRTLKTRQETQQGGLAAARRSEQREELALLDRQGYPVGRQGGSKSLGHAL